MNAHTSLIEQINALFTEACEEIPDWVVFAAEGGAHLDGYLSAWAYRPGMVVAASGREARVLTLTELGEVVAVLVRAYRAQDRARLENPF